MFCWLVLGLEILAFPCNQFLKQEPGTGQDAEQFACTRFKAEYPIFGKVRCWLFVCGMVSGSFIDSFSVRDIF